MCTSICLTVSRQGEGTLHEKGELQTVELSLSPLPESFLLVDSGGEGIYHPIGVPFKREKAALPSVFQRRVSDHASHVLRIFDSPRIARREGTMSSYSNHHPSAQPYHSRKSMVDRTRQRRGKR